MRATTAFMWRRRSALRGEAKQYEKEQAKIEQLQEAADKLHLWAFMGNDKLHKRAFSMEKRMERIRTGPTSPPRSGAWT